MSVTPIRPEVEIGIPFGMVTTKNLVEVAMSQLACAEELLRKLNGANMRRGAAPEGADIAEQTFAHNSNLNAAVGSVIKTREYLQEFIDGMPT